MNDSWSETLAPGATPSTGSLTKGSSPTNGHEKLPRCIPIRVWAEPPICPVRVADDLRALYGGRLIDVFVFGSRARGDAGADSDLDLLVVLDAVDDPWVEHRRMEEILWRHTRDSGTTIMALPVAQYASRSARTRTVRARAEAIPA